jgi:hypothetical protein
MGLISFTNITLAVFFIYLAMVGKTFYETFFPDECAANDKSSRCLQPMSDWQANFKLSLCFTKSNAYPQLNTDCIQFQSLSSDTALAEPKEG